MDSRLRLVFGLIVPVVLLSAVQGYPAFLDKIPNGNKVPHPCNPDEIWQGVGHEAKGGGGVRNPFGIALKANGYVWDETLCMADSDGDGLTNGEELGDPNCQWTEGSAVTLRTTDLSHPGVCTPLNSDLCQGRSDFVVCEPFHCAALNESETFKYSVRIPQTPLPPDERTYKCVPFEFPQDAEYHTVAIKPYVNNWNLMDYVLIYGCTDDAVIEVSAMNQSFDCVMGTMGGCSEFIAAWKVGDDGYCYVDVAGLPVGMAGYKRAFLELHWNHPSQGTTFGDSLGFDFYLTKNLREYDVALMAIGQLRLNIPPMEESYTVEGRCHSKCTEQTMTGDINVVSVYNHMHDAGKSARTQVRVPGTRVDYIAVDPVYDDDAPINHVIDPPFVVRPGDQFELLCTYTTMDRNKTTVYGPNYDNEMCYAFISYYPAQNLQSRQCVSSGIFEACEPIESLPTTNGCDFNMVLNESRTEVTDRYSKITERCSPFMCKKECKAYVKALYQQPCYNKENRPYLKEIFFNTPDATYDARIFVRDFWSRVESCNTEIAREAALKALPGVTDEPTDAASRDAMNFLVVMCLMLIVSIM